MAYPIKNDILYITNVATLNEIYSSLGKALQTKGKIISLKTKAGDFMIEREKAKSALDRLKELDRLDSTQNKEDGKIEDTSYQQKVPIDRSAGPIKQGFKIDFVKFTPSKLWFNNYNALEQYAAASRVRRTHFVQQSLPPYLLQPLLWIPVTTATLSGFTPNLLKFAETLCNPSFHCTFSLVLYGHNSFTNHQQTLPSNKIAQDIRWNLSFNTNAPSIFRAFVHERGHLLMRSSAHLQRTNFASLFRDWLSHQEIYKKSAKNYFDFYDRHSNQKDPFFFLRSYILEELVDIPFIQYFNPDLIPMIRLEWLEYFSDFSQLSQVDFDQESRKRYPYSSLEGVGLYLAMILAKGKTLGVDQKIIQSLQERAEALLKSSPDALSLFQATLDLSNAASDYVKKNEEFKRFIDQNIPPSMKRSPPTL